MCPGGIARRVVPGGTVVGAVASTGLSGLPVHGTGGKITGALQTPGNLSEQLGSPAALWLPEQTSLRPKQ